MSHVLEGQMNDNQQELVTKIFGDPWIFPNFMSRTFFINSAHLFLKKWTKLPIPAEGKVRTPYALIADIVCFGRNHLN